LNKPKFGADPGRRAGLRKANEKALKYLVDETKDYVKETFEKEAQESDTALANCLFAILLREVIGVHPDGDSYMFIGNSFKKVEGAAPNTREQRTHLSVMNARRG
jgi:hypothetical protein